MRIPRHWFVAMALALSIGPNLLVMSGFMQIQAIIQNALNSSSYSTMWISIIANVSFAVFIPLGPLIALKVGPRVSFTCAALISAFTYFLTALSSNLVILGISRAIEGALTGTQLMVMIPLMFRTFPGERRNRVLGILVAVMFGSVVLGAILGSISQSQDTWRWLFLLCAFCSALGLLVRRSLPEEMFYPPGGASDPETRYPGDRVGIILLFMLGVFTVITLGNILPNGISSPVVYLPGIISVLLLLSLVYVELHVKNPIVGFKLVTSRRSLLGAAIAILSNLLMLIAMSGLGFGMKIAGNIPSNALPGVYCWLVISVTLASVLAASLFDRIGAPPLLLLGSACILFASYRFTVLGRNASIDELRLLLVVLASGSGLNFVVGMITCALGGTIHQMPRTMAVVQFLRVLFYSSIAPFAQWALTNLTTGQLVGDTWSVSVANPVTLANFNQIVQHFTSLGASNATARQLAIHLLLSDLQSRAALSSTHHIFFVAVIGSACLFALSCILLLMGKGPTVSSRGSR